MLQFSPNIVAGGDINPYAIVKISTAADFTGLAATAAADIVLGVADASTKRFDSALHAAAGDPISFQPSPCVQLVAGTGGVTRGAALIPGANGTAVATTTATNVALFTALQSAAATEVFWAYRMPSVKAL